MLNHVNMCTGRDSKKSEYHKGLIRYHEIMSNFYSIDRKDQLVFMAMFNQIVDNSKQEGGSDE